MRAPARVLDCGTDAWPTPFDLAAIEAADLAHVDREWLHQCFGPHHLGYRRRRSEQVKDWVTTIGVTWNKGVTCDPEAGVSRPD